MFAKEYEREENAQLTRVVHAAAADDVMVQVACTNCQWHHHQHEIAF
jgi:hypothetical protein